MIIRIRSKDGTFRFEVQPTDDFLVLVQKILGTSESIDPSTLALSSAPKGGEMLVSSIKGPISTLGLNHGDLLFATYTDKSSRLDQKPPVDAEMTEAYPIANDPNKPWCNAIEPAVDQYWNKQDGKIPRPKGKNGCRCGPKSMCDYCMPLEPYDAEYQSEHSIKHLSYHAYLRKISAAKPMSSQSSTYIPPLTEPSYKIAVPCPSGSHPSWPNGICTKCQVAPVTLSRQNYRMVDHVQFAHPGLIENFLSFWRRSGNQRFAYLLGRYVPYDKVPMGIEAVVEVLYEPAQEDHVDGLEVEFPWADKERVEKLAAEYGLEIVGMLFSDLTAEKTASGEVTTGVVPKRHAFTFFLSSLEVVLAATMQKQHRVPSQFSSTGAFGSRFVTCVLSGDSDGNISIEAYQVSDQAEALVDAGLVEASVQPGIMRLKEEGDNQYVPEVFYRFKNEYGLEVKESAKPCFPVEYLLVNVTHGFPNVSNPLFNTSTPFPAANRKSQPQTIAQVGASLNALLRSENISRESIASGESMVQSDPQKMQKVVQWLSDFNMIDFISTTNMFNAADMNILAQVVKEKSVEKLVVLASTPEWTTFQTILSVEAPDVPPRDHVPQVLDDGFEIPPDVDVPPEETRLGGDAPGIIICPHCTFENLPGTVDCEICGLPVLG